MTADQGKRIHGEQVSEERQPYLLTGSGLRLMLSAPAATAPARAPSERSAAADPCTPPPPTRPRSGPSGGGPTQLARAGCGVDNGAVDVGAVANTVAIAVPPLAVARAAVALTPLATAGAAHATTSAVGARPSPAASAAALKCSAALVAAGATLVSADAKQL